MEEMCCSLKQRARLLCLPVHSICREGQTSTLSDRGRCERVPGCKCVMSAMGFHQCPGRPMYTLGSPRFDEITQTLLIRRTFANSYARSAGGKFYS